MRTRFILIFFTIAFSLSAQQKEVKYLSGTDKDHTVTWDFFCTNGMNT